MGGAVKRVGLLVRRIRGHGRGKQIPGRKQTTDRYIAASEKRLPPLCHKVIGGGGTKNRG